MFEDRRSKRVVLVAHCVLNQNARIDGCAYFPGAMDEAARVIVDSGVGVLQMPCPELYCLGLDRSGRMRDGKDIGIREALLESEGREGCLQLVDSVMVDVREYGKHGFEIVGVVGNDGSPACGVATTHYVDGSERPGAGAFMMMLRQALVEAGFNVPFVALRDNEWDERTERVRALVNTAGK
jgi:predicted secreted protein